MEPLALGALALILVIIALRAFVGANPRLLARALRYFGAALLALAAIGLAVFDRVGLAFLAGSMAWGLFTGGNVWPHGWPYFGFPSGRAGSRSRPRASTGEKTSVRTEWIELELDHDTGEMQGGVLKGSLAGRALSSLTEDDVLTLYREAGSEDAETARLLEAYLDRNFGSDWRAKAARAKSWKRGRPDSGMSRDEAFKVLGLRPGADADAIRAAHRKLMLQNHPDLGGSSDAAARINEAKDVLLRA
jgi:DnaJ domain